MTDDIETCQEVDGRWIAEIPRIPGVMAYGATREEAIERVKALNAEVKALIERKFGAGK